MVHDVEQDHASIRDGVEDPVERGKIDAIEVRDSVPLSKVRWDRPLAYDFTPLTVDPDPGEDGSEALPDRLRRLFMPRRQGLPGRVGLLEVGVNDNGVRPKRPVVRLGSSTAGKGTQETRAGGVRPLNPLRTFDSESKLEAEGERPIEPGSARRMSGLLQVLQQPVTAHGISRLLEQGHHELGGPERDVDAGGLVRQRHAPYHIYTVIRSYLPWSRGAGSARHGIRTFLQCPPGAGSSLGGTSRRA